MPLISVLEEIQTKYHYLRREAMILISEDLGLPLSQVYSMATFYNASSPEKKGMFTCSGSAMANSPAISPTQNSFAATKGSRRSV
jgi:hypothetical protein